MPRKAAIDPALRANLEALKAARAAQAAAEKPIRAARAKLAQRLSGFHSTLARATSRLSDALHKEGYHGAFYTSWVPEHDYERACRNFGSALVDLQTFDALHGVEGATYPTSPVIDRDAIRAQGKAAHDAELARFRPANPRVDDKPDLSKFSATDVLIITELRRLGWYDN